MFAQNPGSFEDQFLLLIDLRVCLKDEFLLRPLREDFDTFRRNMMHKPQMPLAHEYTFDTKPSIDRVLTIYFEEIKQRYEL